MKPKYVKNFNAFTVKYPTTAGRIITEVNLSPALDPNIPIDSSLKLYKTSALWDTGATGSVVTQNTAKAVGLIPKGIIDVNHAGGTSRSKTYIASFFLPNKVVINGVMVTECADAGNFGAIIGMDIITMGDFAITNVNEKTLMTFRIPSIEMVDYAREAQKISALFANAKRNDLCPCGKKKNGKRVKYKHCHGK